MKTGVQSRQLFDQKTAAEFYRASCAEQYGLSQDRFVAILEEIVRKQFGEAAAGAGNASTFVRSLRLEELALARACAQGEQHAWDVFLTRYREGLYMAAHSIAREQSAARELADSIYADLYGTRVRDGERISKLASYTGRGSLAGWLRTVLAQQHVDQYRKSRRMVSLEEETEKGVQFATATAESGTAKQPQEQSKLERVTDAVLTQLSSEERFLLASYFLDGRRLAEIAKILGVHESTISRKLDKLTSNLRKRIRDSLVHTGMSRAQAEELLEIDVRDLALDIKRTLGHGPGNETSQESHAATFSMKEKISPEGLNLKDL